MKKVIAASFISLIMSTHAHALTTCNAILQQGIYDRNDTLSEGQKHEVVKKSWCRTNEKERGGGLGFSIKKIFNLNGKGKKSDINKFCQSNYNNIKSDHKFKNINRQINSTIVNAWSQCIGANTQQVSHYIKPTHSPGKIIYGIVFKPDPNGNPPKNVKLNYWAVSGAKCPVNFNGKSIDQNIFEVTCTRSPKSAVIINARSSSYGHNLRTVQLQAYEETAPTNTWKINQGNHAVIVDNDTSFVKAKICYKQGNVQWVGIDNSNKIDPRIGNFVRLNKGSCSIYGIESGPNIGIFMPKGSSGSASGSFELIN